ncbi:MAG: aquaporin [Anaerolineae bacterium]|nr:aquaporin [Anaerolineae bacterium]
MKNSGLLRDGLAEFIGTFMLIFVGAGAATGLAQTGDASASLLLVALAHGLILITIITTFGHISGAHVNPAVTLGLLVGGKIDVVRAVAYWIVQFAGGIAGAAMVRVIFPDPGFIGQTVPALGITDGMVIVIEGLLTAFLVSAVYQNAVYAKTGNIAGLAIGLTLAAAILLGGPLTGGSLNPARTLGPALVSGVTDSLPAYLIGMAAGAVAAGLLHGYVFTPTRGAGEPGR